MYKTISVFFLLLFAQQSFCQQPVVSVKNLKVEGLAEMNGLEEMRPRLSWQIVSQKRDVNQHSYQILVASSLDKINRHDGDVWNSQKVESTASINVAYPGSNLLSGRQYYWKVRVWTNKGLLPGVLPANGAWGF
jgi:alpha-L-rhamnosidase